MARDPDRIERILLMLAEIWEVHSDWRLGQLIKNAMDVGGATPIDIFYYEDNSLERDLDILYRTTVSEKGLGHVRGA